MNNEKNKLKKEFDSLQQQQKEKFIQRKAKQKVTYEETLLKKEPSFGICDDLDLKVSEHQSEVENFQSSDLVEHLNEQIRELKDETGRLYKLLAEREHEIKQLKKKIDNHIELSNAVAGSDTVATKIVELSKRVRELSAEITVEQTKNKQLTKRINEFEISRQVDSTSANKSPHQYTRTEDFVLNNEQFRALQEKQKCTENKMSEYRNQYQQCKQELKYAQKVISNEVGEGVTIQSLMSSSVGWRGRAQQILALQKKVTELKSQLESRDSERGNEYNELYDKNSARVTQDAIQREQIRRMEKERKEHYEKVKNELNALEKDYDVSKQKLEASKARNKVLANENKAGKEQIQMLLDKGRNDDELIQALLKQQTTLKSFMSEHSKSEQNANLQLANKTQDLELQLQQCKNTIEQQNGVITNKEAKLRQLETENEQIKQNTVKINKLGNLFQSDENGAANDRDSLESSPEPPRNTFQSLTSREPAITPEPTHTGTGVSGISSALSNSDKTADYGKLQEQCAEFKTVSQALQVERDRLNELVALLNTRIEDAQKKNMLSASELKSQKHKCVKLEKQLGRCYADQSARSKNAQSARKGSKMNSDSNSKETESLDDLLVKVEIQTDEIEALKAALQSTLSAKEKDLRIYTDTIEQTKQVFLEGLRQHRSHLKSR